jgi:hypothetical protein
MIEPIHILSLGAGVQSSTLALMASHGEITPIPTCGVFADTKAEPEKVYVWLDWLEKQLPYPVHRVSKGDLMAESLRKRVNQTTGKPYYSTYIPAFVKTDTGRGMLHRKCTYDFKVLELVKAARRIAGDRLKQWRKQYPKKVILQLADSGQKPPPLVIQWIGISTDEASRMKPSREPWIAHRFPLVEHGMSRQSCLKWMRQHGYPEPPKSACVFCPYHNDSLWSEMKLKSPNDFKRAVDYELAFQKVCSDGGSQKVPYLHSSLVSLSEAQFGSNDPTLNLFNNECEGMCGV